MHPLPPDFDPTVFVGNSVERVTFAANFVEIRLEREIRITAYGRVTVSDAQGETVAWTDRPDVESEPGALVSTLTEPIIGAAVQDDATLALQLGGGAVLRVWEDTKMYEAYRLRIGSREIVV